MKRLLTLLLAMTILLSLCACQGNFGSVNLKAPADIPEDGEIDKNTIAQIKNENAIAIFVGTSGDLKYEWTVFGSAVQDAKTVNLRVQFEKNNDGGIRVELFQEAAFGFSATLAIHLNERWNAQSAKAYAGENAFATVSITGSKNTILNVSLDGTVGTFVIQPDPLPDELPPTQNTAPSNPEGTTNAPTAPTKPDTQTLPATKPTEPTQPSKPAENGGKDKYHTDPVPDGKPHPVEPEDQEVDKDIMYTCTFSIECSTILNNLDNLSENKSVPLSPQLREEVRKLDQYDEDTRLLCKYHIGTAEELSAFREEIIQKIHALVQERNGIYNKIRRAAEPEKTQLKEQAKVISQQISPLRKEFKCADRIWDRSLDRVKNLLEQERQMETQAMDRNKERSNER